MKFWMGVVSLLSMAIPAMAKGEDSYMPGPLSYLSSTQEDEKRYDQLRLGIRVPFLGGDIDDEGDGKWSDFFNTGFGIDINGAYLFRTSDKFAIGPYLGTAFDFYGGNKQTIADPLGDFTIKPETMVVTRLTIGVKLRENLGPKFFLEQHMGIGVAIYSATDFAFEDAGGSITVRGIDSSVTFAFELGLRAGFAVSRRVDLGMGFAFETNGAPDAGPDFDFTLNAQENFVLSFFINLNF